MINKWHSLYSGRLTDMPGRNESWEEQVRYLGSARWRLRVVGTDFQGFGSSEFSNERMGTKRLIKWAIERDSEDEEGDNDDLMTGTPVERVIRLSEIAREVGAALCVEILDKYERGEWPRRPKVPRTLIKEVVGATKRGMGRIISERLLPPDDPIFSGGVTIHSIRRSRMSSPNSASDITGATPDSSLSEEEMEAIAFKQDRQRVLHAPKTARSEDSQD